MSIPIETYVGSRSDFFAGFQNSASSENIRLIWLETDEDIFSKNKLIIALSIGKATSAEWQNTNCLLGIA